MSILTIETIPTLAPNAAPGTLLDAQEGIRAGHSDFVGFLVRNVDVEFVRSAMRTIHPDDLNDGYENHKKVDGVALPHTDEDTSQLVPDGLHEWVVGDITGHFTSAGSAGFFMFPELDLTKIYMAEEYQESVVTDEETLNREFAAMTRRLLEGEWGFSCPPPSRAYQATIEPNTALFFPHGNPHTFIDTTEDRTSIGFFLEEDIVVRR